MFKVREDIYLAASDSANHSKTYGVFKKSAEDDSYAKNPLQSFVDPSITEIDKISVLHWPEDNIIQNKPIEFVIRKNGARGNVQVKLVNVKNQSKDLPLQVLDPDRYLCRFVPALGIQKIRIYFNTVEIPCSPLPLYVRAEQPTTSSAAAPASSTMNLIPVFLSGASKIRCFGAGITSPVSLQQRNEFTVDASSAGDNILFVVVYGPAGQCDNLAIKHTGGNIYSVSFVLHDPGEYVIILKWGNESIPGSPFQFSV